MNKIKIAFSLAALPFIIGGFFYLVKIFGANPFLATLTFFSRKNSEESLQIEKANSEIEKLKKEISELKKALESQEENYQLAMDEIYQSLEVLNQLVASFQDKIFQTTKETATQNLLSKNDCRIDLNKATLEELQKLVGIGPVLAQRIIEARPFSSVYELIKVPGIGEKTLKKILEQNCAFVEAEKEKVEEEKENEEKIVSSCPVDINTATKEELQAIVGIGPALAEKIILARPFSSLNDLLRVSGIGEKTLQKIIEQGCAVVSKTSQPSSVSAFSFNASLSGSRENSSSVFHPVIIISEIKIAEKTGDKNVFIELYNPNNFEVDLTNWYIFKNDNSFITKTLFQGKKILPKSYFLLTRTDSLWQESADLLFDGALEKNTKITLKNPSAQIVEEISWGEIPPEKSFGKIFDENTQNYSNNWEIQAPTPKEKNNRLPIAIFSLLGENLFVGEEILFDASSSTDPDGKIKSFIWDFNDGEISATSSSTISHVFNNPGKFQVKLLVEDEKGALSFPATTTIEIKNQPKPILKVSPLFLSFRGEKEEKISSQFLTIENIGNKELNWIAESSFDWILLSTSSGTILPFSSTTLEISVDTLNLDLGKNTGEIQIEAPEAENGFQEISLTLNLFPKTLKTVVINEIAWMGTKGDSNDEWIELFNNTSSTIDISGWILKAQDGTPAIIFPNPTTIPAFSYFLLERTDDNTVSDIKADLIYSGALLNTGEALELRDQEGNLTDLVDCSQGWFAGKASPDYISMERIDPNLPGSYSDNWADNNLILKNGKDASGNDINGTPKSQNSVYQLYNLLNF